jgi:hypothetical protein
MRKKKNREYNSFIETSVNTRIATNRVLTFALSQQDMFHFLLTAINLVANLLAFSS